MCDNDDDDDDDDLISNSHFIPNSVNNDKL